MWLKKEEYDGLFKTNKEIAEKLQEAREEIAQYKLSNNFAIDEKQVAQHKQIELDKLIAECEEIKKKPQEIKLVPVEPLKKDEEPSFWNSIADILDNRHFQIFIYDIREKLLSQFGSSNSEETAGGLQALQIVLNQMSVIKQKYMDLLKAEEYAKRSS
jgi:hypothetical protein